MSLFCRTLRPVAPRTLLVSAFGVWLWLFAAASATAQPLQDIVLRALEIDPSLTEASANVSAAESRTESARRQHWPRLGVAAAEAITDRQRDFFEQDQLRTYATVNVWSGGGIEAQVKSGKDAERYYRSKASEGREDVVYRVASLYLEGLRAEEELSLARTNLLRHNSLMRDLGVVAQLDSGRRSDLTQAQSRQAQARARVVTAETALGVVRSRLARYTGGVPISFEPVKVNALAVSEPVTAAVARQPEYLAQMAEVERLQAQVEVAKARRWPKLDVEGSVGNDTQTRVLLNWDLVSPSNFSDVDSARQQVTAAQARLSTVDFDLRERLDAARVSYEQAGRKQQATEDQIASAQQVVVAFEEQFQIARRSMLDLLNAYAELSTVESSASAARAEYRALALQYLRACGNTEAWVRASRDELAGTTSP